MKKSLITLVIVLLMILTGITIIKGVTIGKWTVLGIKQIQEKNNQLDEQIQTATRLASTDYQSKIRSLNNAIKDLQSKKQNYEDMVNVSTEGQVNMASQSQDYKIEYLWIQIGNYAKAEGVEMTMEVVKSSSGTENLYDLSFTAKGAYIGIADFITHIEDDSDLGFRIENFKMISSSEKNNILQATFICKDIKISGISSSTFDNTLVDNNSENNTNDNNTNVNTIDGNTIDNATR